MLASVFLLSSKAKREPCLPLLKREKTVVPIPVILI